MPGKGVGPFGHNLTYATMFTSSYIFPVGDQNEDTKSDPTGYIAIGVGIGIGVLVFIIGGSLAVITIVRLYRKQSE